MSANGTNTSTQACWSLVKCVIKRCRTCSIRCRSSSMSWVSYTRCWMRDKSVNSYLQKASISVSRYVQDFPELWLQNMLPRFCGSHCRCMSNIVSKCSFDILVFDSRDEKNSKVLVWSAGTKVKQASAVADWPRDARPMTRTLSVSPRPYLQRCELHSTHARQTVHGRRPYWFIESTQAWPVILTKYFKSNILGKVTREIPLFWSYQNFLITPCRIGRRKPPC